ncbi:AEC family transporter [Psychromonas sp.]|nr:AEC family transporter [Psychromonas sp.]
MFLESLQFSFSIIGPICLLLFLGWFLRKTNTINDAFIDIGSKLVFKVTLPTLLFLSIIKTNREAEIDFPLVIYALIANLAFFLFSVAVTKYWVKEKQDHGVIIQGAYRSNIAIIGLAYIANVYGDAGIALAAVYLAFNTTLYNILAVIILSPKQKSVSTAMILDVFTSVLKNPLIIGILLGLTFFVLAIPVPNVLINTGLYFSDMTLPLALLCTGGSLNIKALKDNSFNCRFSSALKIIAAPILITAGAYLFGFTGLQLGVVFFMSAAPTAAASYVMARAMGHNADLAANIVAMTTIGSILTCSLGLSALYWLQLI